MRKSIPSQIITKNRLNNPLNDVKKLPIGAELNSFLIISYSYTDTVILNESNIIANRHHAQKGSIVIAIRKSIDSNRKLTELKKESHIVAMYAFCEQQSRCDGVQATVLEVDLEAELKASTRANHHAILSLQVAAVTDG